MNHSFKITKGDYIELFQLLKAVNLAGSGSEAKMFVEEGIIYLNGEKEFRKRAKVRPGDKVELKSGESTEIIDVN